MVAVIAPSVERDLKRRLAGDVLFDPFDRGRYATDASIYQMIPDGVVVPRTNEDIEAALSVARDWGLSVLPRGGGTSQCGQTVNEALVVDTTKYFNKVLELDVEGRRCVVEPGIVLDELNRFLKPYGLWFPVDVSTASRATIGGMTANNSCGGRSIKYGTMRDNVLGLRALLADGSKADFGPVQQDDLTNGGAYGALVRDMLALGAREADEINERFPKVMRRVGGYNIDALVPQNEPNNIAHLLVGSEGTLGFFEAIELKLSPLLPKRAVGICHFPTFYKAMDATQHLVPLGPIGVELVDSTMISLGRDIPIFKKTLDEVVRGDPAALLLVEFAEEDDDANRTKIASLEERMGDLGFSWSGEGEKWGGVVPVFDSALQGRVTEVRKSGLNIMMSMKAERKPVSFVEDCAVELSDLAEYTQKLTEIFERHGTSGTWYAHASVGCLHVRPVLNMKLDQDVKAMRAIAEEAFELVRSYKGSHSGEHGDGIVRSEFHEKMFGTRMVEAFGEVKARFDPEGFFNPGKIVDPPKMDDREKFRFAPDYAAKDFDTALDWSAWPGKAGGFQGAVEMCNNNGACRKLQGGAMCPSYRVTRNEKDLTRGRANTLRLALSGQLGEDALSSDAMMDAMRLCVSCKACKRECPTGVDMARMKIEVLHERAKRRGLSLHDRLVGYLPDYAPYAAKVPWLLNLRNKSPFLARLLEGPSGFSAERALPAWRRDPFHDWEVRDHGTGDVVLFGDTFNRYFEPENLRAATRVLEAGGIKVSAPSTADDKPLCCGRTYLSVGLVDKARAEARRLIDTLLPDVEAGRSIVGLEPSCLLMLRDEIPALVPGEEAERISKAALLFEEFIVREADKGRFNAPLKPLDKPILLHGHCHQKAFNVMSDVEQTLRLI
ncbi:MAG: FAD-linked oxidase C-terminal domain-containing protein, partial [Pseudomonadota bacterium]